MNSAILKELREWTALGFYEALDKPWPMAFGEAFRCMYENMDIVIPEGKYLIPFEPMEYSRNKHDDGIFSPESMILNHNYHAGLQPVQSMAEIKKEKYPQHAEFIDKLLADLIEKFPHFGGYTHNNPDIRRVVNEGFESIEAELNNELAAAFEPREVNLLKALKKYAEGVKAFHRRTQIALEEKAVSSGDARYRQVASAFGNCFMKPSKTFLEGLLAVNFVWHLDGCDSIGRVDQVLGELWEKDLADGTLDIDFARSLIDEFYQSFDRFNGWNLQIGGYTPDGRDGCNKLTSELLDACIRNPLPRPNVAFRITSQTPEELLIKAMEALRNGAGKPALYNDELYVKTLLDMDLGLTIEDAREIGFGGCTETMIAGMSNVGSLEGTINLAQCLQLTLNDGFDPIAKKQIGPHTGKLAEFISFDQFMSALKTQIEYDIETFVKQNKINLKRRFTEGDPKLHRTLFTRDCVKKHKSFEAGGARYNWAILTYQGIAVIIDSLAAIKKLVFDEKQISAVDLLKALKANFVGYEKLRGQLKAAPKYGNDIRYVDELGSEIMEFACRTILKHKTPRGGRYIPSCIVFWTYFDAGTGVGATPNGRKAFEVLPDSIGPVAGADRKGPTAMLNSICKWPLHLAIGTPVMNIRLPKNILVDRVGIEKSIALIRTFFDKGGPQLQITVADSAEMRAAQDNPADHENLIVRIGGFSVYFNDINRELQDSVILRTEMSI
jgi:formate C-acetyltransferase